MIRNWLGKALLGGVVMLGSLAGAESPASGSAADESIPPWMLRPFKPLPASFHTGETPALDAMVGLGRRLYMDARLSEDGKVSCNSCHDLRSFGVDGRRVSTGVEGRHGRRNAPSVFNAGGYVAQFWDGRAPSLEAQAEGPFTNPVEMGLSPEGVAAKLKAIPEYQPLFAAAFPGQRDPITYANALLTIATFERQLITPGRFDQFLKGQTNALSREEKHGLKVFVTSGCSTCHNGAPIGATSFQKLGLVEDYPDQVDLGRFEVTHQTSDKMNFRVPSLRNVAKTGPYFHDGSVTDLRKAIVEMGRYELGKQLTDPDVDSIIAFLGALTGEPVGISGVTPSRR